MDVVSVAEDPAVERADRLGIASFDAFPEAPAMVDVAAIIERLRAVPTPP